MNNTSNSQKSILESPPLKEEFKNESISYIRRQKSVSNYGNVNLHLKFLSVKPSRESESEEKSDSIFGSSEQSSTHGLFFQAASELSNYSYFPRSRYWIDSKLRLLSKRDPFINLKIISSNVDTRTITTRYYLGINGLDCSMRNYHREYTSIGRQQINEEFVRPNDIMLFPTDPSISRSHLRIYHRQFFIELRNYKNHIDLISRLKRSKGSNKYFLPDHIWASIIVFLKPSKKIAIVDNGTIYGTYVRIKEHSSLQNIMNSYIMLSTLKELYKKDSFFLKDKFTNDYLNSIKYGNEVNDIILSEKNSQCDLMKLFAKTFNDHIAKDLLTNFNNYLQSSNTNDFISPFTGKQSSFEYLFKKYNNILKESQVFLSSSHAGFIVTKIGTLSEVLANYFNNSLYNQVSKITVISFDKIIHSQKIDPTSQLYTLTTQDAAELFAYTNNKCINYKTIHLLETEGDPCGVMNRIQSIILVYNEDTCNKNMFTLLYQKGFLLGKTSTKKCFYSANMDSEVFIYYNSMVGLWGIKDVSSIEKEGAIDNFGLWICTCPDKGMNNRFDVVPGGYKIGHGDQIRISETVMEVEYNI